MKRFVVLGIAVASAAAIGSTAFAQTSSSPYGPNGQQTNTTPVPYSGGASSQAPYYGPNGRQTNNTPVPYSGGASGKPDQHTSGNASDQKSQ